MVCSSCYPCHNFPSHYLIFLFPMISAIMIKISQIFVDCRRHLGQWNKSYYQCFPHGTAISSLWHNKSFTLSQCNYWVNLTQSQRKCSHLAFHVAQTMLSSDYMRHQAHITPYMRAILVHWLMEVGHEYMLKRSTVNLAINFVDRMLTQVWYVLLTKTHFINSLDKNSFCQFCSFLFLSFCHFFFFFLPFVILSDLRRPSVATTVARYHLPSHSCQVGGNISTADFWFCSNYWRGMQYRRHKENGDDYRPGPVHS